ncbi:MAG: hypothetical protein ACKOW9_04305 [Candidatus Paceibacterota bacterium]
MKVVTVIPLGRVPFEEELTYFTALPVAVNDVVSVTVRKRNILALVSQVTDARDSKMLLKNIDFNLRKINEVKGPSIFNPYFIDALSDLAKYSLLQKNFVLSYVLPQVFKDNYDTLKDKITPSDQTHEDNIKSEKALFQAPLEDRVSYYKTMIRESFALQKSVFIILPRESDIEYFEQALSRGIENFVVTLHGGIPEKKLLEKITNALGSEHALLILATAQYVALPRKDIRVFVLEHESSTAYKTVVEPGLDLRTLVEIFATKSKTKLIMSDTLLRFETIGRKDIVHFGEVRPLSFRIQTDTDIVVTEKGVKKELDNKWHPVSLQSLEAIKHTSMRGENSFIFTLRKGLATYTICKHCETPVFCPDCKAPLVLYLSKDKKKRMFVCNKCRLEKNPDTVCASCGSWNLIPLGIGTELAYEELAKHIPKEKIFEINKEVVKTKAGAMKIIKEFEKTPGGVLIGTEMALFYVKEKVTCSVMISFDSLWSIPNFKISEKILQLILHTLEKTEKKLLIETRNVTDPAITGIINGNLSNYVREELRDRETLEYPPYRRFIKIAITEGAQKQILKKELAEKLKAFEPVSYGNNLLLRLPNQNWSLPELYPGGSLDEELAKNLPQIALLGYVHVQVDPEDVL